MFIKSARLRDFRVYEDVSLEFEPFTIILGCNHEGKSTLQHAIKLGFTGTCDGTDAQGRGANDQIRVGAKKAFLDFEIVGQKGPMPFGLSYGPNAQGRKVTTQNPEPFLRWLDRNQAKLSCAFQSDYFVMQKESEQKAILSSLVLPAEYDFPPSIIEACVQAHIVGGESAIWDEPPVKVIDVLYDRAFGERKTKKAEAKGVYIPDRPTKPRYTTEEVNSHLSGHRLELAQLSANTPAGNDAEIATLEEKMRQAQRELSKDEKDIEDTYAEIESLPGMIKDTRQLHGFEEVAARRATCNSLNEQLDIVNTAVEELRQEKALFTALRDTPSCPTCFQIVTADFISQQVKRIEEVISQRAQAQSSVMNNLRDLGDVAGAEKLVAGHKAAEMALSIMRARVTRLSEAVTLTKNRIRDLSMQIEEAKLQPKPDNSKAHELSESIALWEAHLQPALRYEAMLETIDKAIKQKKILDEEVERLEKLVAYFGPDGIKAQLIQANIRNFSESVNHVLKSWDYQAELNIEPYSFTVTHAPRTLALKQLSESEKLMFGIALQTAIAIQAGINCVVVDKGDTFIEQERVRLYSVLNGLLQEKKLQQAVLILSDARTEAPQREGVAYYAAREGKLVKM